MDQFPVTYCIAMPARRRKMERRLINMGIPHVIVPADDGRDPVVYDRHKLQNAMFGAIGCYSSHLKAMREFISRGGDEAFIVEDDALWHNKFVELWTEIRLNVPDSCPCVKLLIIWGMNTNNLRWGGIDPELHNLKSIPAKTYSTCGYWLRREEAQRIVEFYDREFSDVRRDKPDAMNTSEEFPSHPHTLMTVPFLLADDLTQSTISESCDYNFYRNIHRFVDMTEYLDCDPWRRAVYENSEIPCRIYRVCGVIAPKYPCDIATNVRSTAEALRLFTDDIMDHALLIRGDVMLTDLDKLLPELRQQIKNMESETHWLGLSYRYGIFEGRNENKHSGPVYLQGAIIDRQFLANQLDPLNGVEGRYITRRLCRPLLTTDGIQYADGKYIDLSIGDAMARGSFTLLAVLDGVSRTILNWMWSGIAQCLFVIRDENSSLIDELKKMGSRVIILPAPNDAQSPMDLLLAYAHEKQLGDWLVLVNDGEYHGGELEIPDTDVAMCRVLYLDGEYKRPLIVKNNQLQTTRSLRRSTGALLDLEIHLDPSVTGYNWENHPMRLSRNLRVENNISEIICRTIIMLPGAPQERLYAYQELCKLAAPAEKPLLIASMITEFPSRLEPYRVARAYADELNDRDLKIAVILAAPKSREIPVDPLNHDVELYKWRFDFYVAIELYYAKYYKECYELSREMLLRNPFNQRNSTYVMALSNHHNFYESKYNPDDSFSQKMSPAELSKHIISMA